MKRTFLFATIASILSINAFADPATITTQDYVDTNFQTKIPAGSFGANYSVVTYGANAGTVGERGLYNSNSYGRYVTQTANSNYAYYKDYLPTMNTLNNGLIYLTSANNGQSPIANATSSYHWIPVFSDNNQVAFDHLLTVNSADAMLDYLDASQYIPTMAAMTEKQNKMTCTRWLDNAEHTDENCLLWSIE